MACLYMILNNTHIIDYHMYGSVQFLTSFAFCLLILATFYHFPSLFSSGHQQKPTHTCVPCSFCSNVCVCARVLTRTGATAQQMPETVKSACASTKNRSTLCHVPCRSRFFLADHLRCSFNKSFIILVEIVLSLVT